jgi:hypothetical protein
MGSEEAYAAIEKLYEFFLSLLPTQEHVQSE